MDITLTSFMQEQLRLTRSPFKRYLYPQLPWEARLVGLMGPRGVGKSTMVLQQVIRLTMEVDVPQYANMAPSTGRKLRRMLSIIVGNVRETFFFNQTRVTEEVLSSKISDFTIGPYTFEVGGKKKSHQQIKEVQHAFVVRDDIEYASGDILPLWGFGLLY